MRKTAAVLTSLLLCSVVLAACGDSGSSPSTTTKTATVPSGKLGATGVQACDAPVVAGVSVVFSSVKTTNVSCPTAQAGMLSVRTTGGYAGWGCTRSVSGHSTSARCINHSDTTQFFSGSWYRS